MTSFGYTALALAAGIAVPIMATLNAGLGGRLGNPFAAAAVLCAVAFAACFAAYALTGPGAGAAKWPVFHPGYMAGLLFTVYIASITWLAPRMGVGNAIFIVLLGQLVTSALIDHFGLFGAPKIELSAQRTLGLAVMVIGVILARRPI